MAQDDSKYTKPGVRERIKERVMKGTKAKKAGKAARMYKQKSSK